MNNIQQYQIKNLEQEIRAHRNAYYNGHRTISDADYDALEDQLRLIDPHNLLLDVVGTTEFVPEKDKRKHEIWMPSIQKFQNIEEVKKWMGSSEYAFSYKLDGSSMSLVYKDNKLVQALTRGDGFYGEDRTEIISKYVQSVQSSIEVKNNNFSDCIVWGEVVIRKNQFKNLQEDMIRRGLEPVKSIRNAVAGILNRKDNKDLARYFDFLAHNIFSDYFDGVEIDMPHWKKLMLLKSLGFGVPERNTTVFASFDDFLESYIQDINDYPYLTDGIVITKQLDRYDLEDKTGHHYRWNACYKLGSEQASTKVKNVVWQMGRTGKLTPVSELEPIELSGATISRATCHNAKFVFDNYIDNSVTVELVRSNEIIPKILNVIQSCEKSTERYYTMIVDVCPFCGEELKWSDTGIDLFCVNERCNEKIILGLVHYASVMEMKNISESTIRLLYDNGVISCYRDLYKVKVEDILHLPKIQSKKATNIINSISESISEWSDERFIIALGISSIGKDVSKKLIEVGLDNITESTLDSISGIGDVIKKIIIDNIEYIKTELSETRTFLNISESTKIEAVSGGSLSGLKFILSGSFTTVKKTLEKLITDNGGIIASSVNKELDYLVTNETGTSKYNKAVQLGKKILSESDLKDMI